MTTACAIPAQFGDSAAGWERALDAFLAEKERRSGSRRIVESYSRMLQHFFGQLGKPPEQVRPPEVLAWAVGEARSSCVLARVASCCLTSPRWAPDGRQIVVGPVPRGTVGLRRRCCSTVASR